MFGKPDEHVDDLQTTNNTKHNRKTDNNHLNATKIERRNETQYELPKNDVEAYLNELSDHIHLEGEMIRPKPIDAHLIKLSKIRIETKLFSHSVFVRTRKNVHILPLRCPSTNNEFTTSSNVTKQVFELKKPISKQVIQVENWSNRMNDFSKQLTTLESDNKQEQKQLSGQIFALRQLVTQTSNNQEKSSRQISKLTALEEQLEDLKSATDKQHSQLDSRITILERKIVSMVNAGKYLFSK